MGVFRSRIRSNSHPTDLARHPDDSLVDDQAPESSSGADPIPDSVNRHAAASPQRIERGGSLRTPGRSFHHGSIFSSMDPAQYSSHGVREQTAELASFALSLNSQSLPNEQPSNVSIFDHNRQVDGSVLDETGSSVSTVRPVGAAVPVLSPPASGSSALTEMIRNPDTDPSGRRRRESYRRDSWSIPREDAASPLAKASTDEPTPVTESTSLLAKKPHSHAHHGYGLIDDVENQGVSGGGKAPNTLARAISNASKFTRLLCSPKSWNRRALWQEGVVYPASLLPSVLLGLLLNVLDALSYGMILFPLGEPMFSDLGSDGISMFYVSTIVAQLFFSCGGSIFKGGIGSEMIEVVPFFHKMAFMVLERVGEDNPRAVLATTILSFSISSVLTGLVFFLMGTCKLGSLIGFFPRHILIGCIGGVGFFLVATGIEVSARLPGPLEYNLETLKKPILETDTLALWTIPLFLAIGLLVLKRFIQANFLVGAYFIAVGIIFYVVKFIIGVPMDTLRDNGWVFAAPSSSNPWYHFYTLYGWLNSTS